MGKPEERKGESLPQNRTEFCPFSHPNVGMSLTRKRYRSMAEVFLAASFRMCPSLMNSLEGLTMSSSSPSISYISSSFFRFSFRGRER